MHPFAMLSEVLWTISAICAVAAIGFALLWRSAARRLQAGEALWNGATRALAQHDYDGVRTLATMETISIPVPYLDNSAEELTSGALLLHAADSLEADYEEGRRTNRELEDVLSSLQDAVLVVDGEARLRFLNAAAIRLFEVRIEDVLGAHLLEALPSFRLEAAVRAALLDGQETAREVSLYGQSVRDVLLRVAPVRRSDGSVSGAVTIIQDLTQMRRLERVRRDFVANASHELRTPIANIRATAETILDSPEDPTLVGRFLPALVSEAERLSRLVTDLLDLARADSQADGLSGAPRTLFDLSQVTCEVVSRLTGKAHQNGIEIICKCDQVARIEGDASSLEQVVFNLVDNALIYTPRGGIVRISVKSTPENTVDLVVSDNGIGIPDTDLPRVFERFYRVDKARSRAQGGTGLGLAIVKHIAENHGGHVKVESENGTTFTVTIPSAR